MLGELDKLEERIIEAAEMIRLLREKNQELRVRLERVEQEHSQFQKERTALAQRITKLVDRVDALRMEL